MQQPIYATRHAARHGSIVVEGDMIAIEHAQELVSIVLKWRGGRNKQPIKIRDVMVNVYCPECPPGGTIGHPGGQQKKLLPFGHGMDLAGVLTYRTSLFRIGPR